MMDHNVKNVQDLYDNTELLYKNVVQGKAESIINNLYDGINILKGCWEGKDAGVQIQNVVLVYNALISIRNALAELSKDSSKIASFYREIQNANKANMQSLVPLTYEDKVTMPDYSDNRDTINITSDALKGKTLIDTAYESFADFISETSFYYNNIMENWLAGTGREKAIANFDEFMSNAEKYKATLNNVSESITDAINNYNF